MASKTKTKSEIEPEAGVSIQKNYGTSSTQAAPLPSAWAKETLLTKAERYAEEMQRYGSADWQMGFWAALIIELVARAALSNISPVLLANVKKDEEWQNLFFALGHQPTKPKFKPSSIEISHVFSRLTTIVPKFDARLADSCSLLVGLRNEELHSGGTPFDSILGANWQPEFYESCEVLLATMDRSLADLLGSTKAAAAHRIIAAAKDEKAKAVNKSITAHEKLWQLKPVGEQNTLSAQAKLWAKKQDGHRAVCPACKCSGLLTGAPTSAPNVYLEEGFVIEKQEHLPMRFECIACGLKISGLPQLHASGLGSVYTSKNTYDPAQYYAGTDYSTEDYEPDNND